MATYSKKLKYSLKERVIEGDRRSENILGREKKKDGDVARLTGLETEKRERGLSVMEKSDTSKEGICTLCLEKVIDFRLLALLLPLRLNDWL